jgi:ribonuclease Z
MRSVFYPRLVNGPFGDPAFYVRLAHRGEALLFDCGDLHPLTVREILKIKAVFISHAHIDHLVGFDALLRFFLYTEATLTLYGPPGTAQQIGSRLAGYTWNLMGGYPFTLVVREWGEQEGKEVSFRAANAFRPEPKGFRPCRNGLLLETPAYRVRAVPLDHGGIISLAFTLEETLHVAIHKDALQRQAYSPGPWLTRFKDLVRQGAPADTPIAVPLENAGETVLSLAELTRQIAHLERGMKVSYVTDASPTEGNREKIIALADRSHLLAIEAPFLHRDLARAKERSHLTARLAGELGRKAQAARLMLFHYSPRYKDQSDLLTAEALEAFLRGKSM